MSKLFSDVRETSTGTVVSVHELPDIEGERGLVISGITPTNKGAQRFNICFRIEASSILRDILNDWDMQREKEDSSER